jgi:hypothetical protein
MLAELAAANAAFAVIKGALANGKELHQLGSRVFDYFDNKAAKIQENATKKGATAPTLKSSWPWSGSSSKKKSCVSVWSTLAVRGCGMTGSSSRLLLPVSRREAKEAAAREALQPQRTRSKAHRVHRSWAWQQLSLAGADYLRHRACTCCT